MWVRDQCKKSAFLYRIYLNIYNICSVTGVNICSCGVCVVLSRVHCSVNVKDFKSSWRSGEVFLAVLSSLRPQLVDLSLVQSRSNQENLEEAFHLAEHELHIPRLLEPQGEAD